MITLAQAQTALDVWWQRAQRPRLDVVRAFLANRWSGPDAGIVRVTLVAGQDGQGTAIRVELERLDHALIVQELRPTTARQDGLTLDDIDGGS